LFWFNSYDENVQTHACNFKICFYKNPQPHKFYFLGVEISNWSPFMTSNLKQHYIFWMRSNSFIFQNTFQEKKFWWSFGFDICWKNINNVDILCTHVCTITISWLHYLNLCSYFSVFEAYMHPLNFLFQIFCNVLLTHFVIKLREVQIERCKG
jgi:hypothetical protein